MNETEIAFRLADRYISIQEVECGYDYSIIDEAFNLIDGGIYDDPDMSIYEVLTDIVDNLKCASGCTGVKEDIHAELIPVEYEELMEKVDNAAFNHQIA